MQYEFRCGNLVIDYCLEKLVLTLNVAFGSNQVGNYTLYPQSMRQAVSYTCTAGNFNIELTLDLVHMGLFIIGTVESPAAAASDSSSKSSSQAAQSVVHINEFLPFQ